MMLDSCILVLTNCIFCVYFQNVKVRCGSTNLFFAVVVIGTWGLLLFTVKLTSEHTDALSIILIVDTIEVKE